MNTYDVTISSDKSLFTWWRMTAWCNENIDPDNWDWCRFEYGTSPTFKFFQQQDATAFKLRFDT